MEEKKLCGAEKIIYLNRRTRACGAEKIIYLNRRTRACGAKKECTGIEE